MRGAQSPFHPGKNTAAMRQNLPSTLEEVGYENKSIHNSSNVCIACVCGYECTYVHDNFSRLRAVTILQRR